LLLRAYTGFPFYTDGTDGIDDIDDMRFISILILTAILLFGAGVTTGVLIKSTSDIETPSPTPMMAPNSNRAEVHGAETNGTEAKANELEGKSITLAPASQGKGGEEMPGSAKSFMTLIQKAEKEKGETRRVKKYNVWGAAVEGLDLSQISQALAQVEALKDDGERISVRLKLLARWGESDPKAAFAYAQGLKGNEGKQEALAAVLDSFADKDPEGAIRCVTQLPAGDERNEAMKALVGSLAQSDPAKAIALLSQLPPQDIDRQSQAIGGAWARFDPKAALAWANQQTDPELKASILNGVIPSMARTDPQGALGLAMTLPDNERNSVIGNIGHAYSIQDPQGALAWCNAQSDPQLKAQFAESIVCNLYDSDPQGAVSLALSLPEGGYKQRAIIQLGAQMSLKDPEEALAMLQSLPVGQTKDSFSVAAVNNLAKIDIQAAMNVASGIGNTEQRNEAQQNVAMTWLPRDRAAATQWITSSALPQEVKTRLLQPHPRERGTGGTVWGK